MPAQSEQRALQLENARDGLRAAAMLEDIGFDLIDEMVDLIEQREVEVDQRIDQE
jgi:hypothetical protein